MSRFLTPLRLERCGDYWTHLQAMVYDSDVANKVFIVPAGEVTDLSSVPRLPLAFLLTGDTGHGAGALHDHLYRTGEVSRDVADEVFKEALLASGEPAWRANLMYWGVRLGGWIAWNNHRQAA